VCRISVRRRCSSYRCLNLPFSHLQKFSLDIECHDTAEMIPTLFQEGGESDASGAASLRGSPTKTLNKRRLLIWFSSSGSEVMPNHFCRNTALSIMFVAVCRLSHGIVLRYECPNQVPVNM